MDTIHVQKDEDFIEQLISAIDKNGYLSTWELFKMAYEAEKVTMTPNFSGLKALDFLPHVHFLDHQIRAAEQVIEQMNGRAILADEVGLGKTIEAGLILKEYMIRGLVQKVLILVPASLVNQWVRELNEKFYIPAVSQQKNYNWDYPVIVTSIDTAKRMPHREKILEKEYDFLLIDEAHKIKNHKTKNFEFVRSIRKKYCLLLTATPVQNQLVEIFNLISILKPGLLGNYQTFLEKFGMDRKKMKDDDYLKQLIQKVMIRNTRDETDLKPSKRHIHAIWVDFSEKEREIYQDIESLAKIFPTFVKLTLLREICSSREACYLSLKKLADEQGNSSPVLPIMEKLEQLPHHSKAEKAVELIKSIGEEKVIIFTEYRASQLYLQWFLKQHGITSVPFRGGFKRGKKDWMRQLFEHHAQVLIATEAGGEGINLQFCHHLINYDLPWNPMRLEQRIGRIHRYGQENDVHIYNFAIRHTIEEHILQLLYEKINLFEKVIGNLDAILAELNIQNVEKEIETIYAESESFGEAKIKLDNLSSVIQHTWEQYGKEEKYGHS